MITLRPKLSPQVISPQVITPHKKFVQLLCSGRATRAEWLSSTHHAKCHDVHPISSAKVIRYHPNMSRSDGRRRRPDACAVWPLFHTFSAFLFLVALFLIACAGLVVASPRRSSRPSLARASWPWLVGPYYHATLCHAAICLLFGSVVWLAVHLVELSQPAEHPVVSLSDLYL